MLNRSELVKYIIEALKANGGKATVLEVCRHVWMNHENELRDAGDLLYTWQYDIRWAAQRLRAEGVMRPVSGSKHLPWELV